MTNLTTLYYLRDRRGVIHICDDEGAYCNMPMDGAKQVDIPDYEDFCLACADVVKALERIARPPAEEARRRFLEMAHYGRGAIGG